MTWPEPLTAIVADGDDAPGRFTVYVLDTRPVVVARVTCAVDVRSRCGVFGEMRIIGTEGTTRQRVRACVLLVREALRHAAELGVVRVHTEAPRQLVAFAQRMTNITGNPRAGGRYAFTGDLATIRTHALETSDANGDLRG